MQRTLFQQSPYKIPLYSLNLWQAVSCLIASTILLTWSYKVQVSGRAEFSSFCGRWDHPQPRGLASFPVPEIAFIFNISMQMRYSNFIQYFLGIKMGFFTRSYLQDLFRAICWPYQCSLRIKATLKVGLGSPKVDFFPRFINKDYLLKENHSTSHVKKPCW